MIRLLVADDHPLVRAGIRQLIGTDRGMRVVAEAADGHELLAQLDTARVDVVLFDVDMPGPGFRQMMSELRGRHPAVRVLVVSVHPEGQVGLTALQLGAHGYVNKTQSPEELLSAIRKVHAGGRYVSPGLAERLAEAVQEGTSGGRQQLSAREADVLRLLGGGRSNKEIAAAFGLSPKTVSTYRGRILRKLGLKTTADLVRYLVANPLSPAL